MDEKNAAVRWRVIEYMNHGDLQGKSPGILGKNRGGIQLRRIPNLDSDTVLSLETDLKLQHSKIYNQVRTIYHTN
jgi:hypothetical protein